MKRRDCELTFDERKALETEVFSKLTCPGWLLRVIRLIIPSLILVVACSTTTASVDMETSLKPEGFLVGTSYLDDLKTELNSSETTAEFEAVMPESELILGALISFDKKKPLG